MLNTKYFIQGEAGKEVANQNPGALGEAWFVNEIKWAKNADEEVSIMQTFDPKNTVVIDERFKENVGAFTFSDSVSNQISLASFHPDKMVYTATAEADGYAVFSEIWYKGNKDWKATIDGKLVTFDRVNYLLRGMKIPKGNHEIVFEFKPDSHYKGKWISLVSSILILIAIAFSSFLVIRKQTA